MTTLVESHEQGAGGSRLNWNPATWGVPALAETAVMVGLAIALNLLKVYRMPQGGSITLEMLPLIFLAVRRGVGPALVGGMLYGFLQLAIDPFIVNPAQVALDYPLAFMAVAAAGLVPVRRWRGLAVAVAVGTGARFVFHFLSGVIFFRMYAPAWEGAWFYSITYNLLYLVPEAIITAVVLWPLLKAYDAAFPGGYRR